MELMQGVGPCYDSRLLLLSLDQTSCCFISEFRKLKIATYSLWRQKMRPFFSLQEDEGRAGEGFRLFVP